MGKQSRSVFVRQFEGLDVLEELLAMSGSPLSADEVVSHFRGAQAEGLTASAVIPTLFEEEPHFPNPELAKRLYQNLLGLWDALLAGKPVQGPPKGPQRAKKAAASPPGHFDLQGPDGRWVEEATRYLEALDERGMERLTHAFENKQDDLLAYLDEQGLSDDGWAKASEILFHIFCFLELGSAKGVAGVDRYAVEKAEGRNVRIPEALSAYADQALSEANTQTGQPLTPAEAAKLRGLIRRCMKALWSARS